MSLIPHQYHRVTTACLGLAALLLAGCAGLPAQRSGMPIMTGRVFSRAEICQLVPRVYVGDEAYAEVNSHGLRRFHMEFSAELFRLGVTKWSDRFDCNRFAELYTSVAQTVFYRESFHSRTPAKALALGPFWYVRADGKGVHAIVQMLTERGPMYIDPQSGTQVILTPAEKASVYLQVM